MIRDQENSADQLLSQRSYPLADGILCQFGDAVDSQFVHDIVSVRFHSFWGDFQGQGDALGRGSLRDKLKHFSLALAEQAAYFFLFGTTFLNYLLYKGTSNFW